MATLISCVGDTDPIRNFHDGPLLHLARVLKPEKIILIFSERTLKKSEKVYQALQAIENYDGLIVQEKYVIKDAEIYLFDKMFAQLAAVIEKYEATEEEILLNLSSGTPQVLSALFSINRISGLNMKAYQVASPMAGSNEGVGHDNQKELKKLMIENLDQTENFKSRVIEDKGEKFDQYLIKQAIFAAIERYDYEAAYQLAIKQKLLSKKKQAHLNNRLSQLINAIKAQKLLIDVAQSDYSEDQKLLLNGYLLIELQAKRGLTSEVLIRMKNLAEFVSELYFKQYYPSLILWKDDKPYLNNESYPEVFDFLKTEAQKDGKDFYPTNYLGLPVYIHLFRYFAPESIVLKELNKIMGINGLRNKVAHGFQEIDIRSFKMNHLVKSCQILIVETGGIDSSWLKYYHQINEELFALFEENVGGLNENII